MLVNLNLHKNKLAMKKIIFSALAALAFVGVSSCSSDDNSIGNGDGGMTPPNKKILVIDKLEISKTDEYDGVPTTNNEVITFNYVDNKLTTLVSSELGTLVTISYDDKGNLKEVMDGSINEGWDEQYIISEIIAKPLLAKNVGKVNTMDKGNPVDLTFYSRDNKGQVIGEIQTTIKYDDKPFSAFHTLNTTGIIDLSKKTNVDFGITPGAVTGIDYASKVVPMNNAVYLKHLLNDGKSYYEANVVYDYDNDNYPKSFSYTVDDYGDWSTVYNETDWRAIKCYGTVKITYKELK